MAVVPFHLAFPIRDIDQTRAFYVGVLGATEARSTAKWIDFNFFGHQISAHVTATADDVSRNEVDGKAVPVRHFGVVLPWADWHALADSLRSAEVSFIIEPHVRWPGKVGEQATMFLADPSGNALEFKSFRDPTRLFAT